MMTATLFGHHIGDWLTLFAMLWAFGAMCGLIWRMVGEMMQ